MGQLFAKPSPLTIETQILNICDHYKALHPTFLYSSKGNAIVKATYESTDYLIELEHMNGKSLIAIPCTLLVQGRILGKMKHLPAALDYIYIHTHEQKYA